MAGEGNNRTKRDALYNAVRRRPPVLSFAQNNLWISAAPNGRDKQIQRRHASAPDVLCVFFNFLLFFAFFLGFMRICGSSAWG